jgi:HK97 family phage major capsid protein
MKTLTQFIEEKGLTMDSFNELDHLEQVKLYKELNENNANEYKALKEKVDGSVTSEELAEVATKFEKQQEENVNKIHAILEAHGYALAEATKNRGEAKGVNNFKAELEAQKEFFNDILEKKVSNGFITVKAPGTMTIGGNVSGGDVPLSQRVPGLNTIASRNPRILDLVTIAQANSNKISWVYQANQDGTAGQTGEGLAKNQIDFDMVVAEESLHKTTAYIKVSTEMLNDIDFMESEINNELTRELRKAVEAQVYSGDGTGNNHNGIKTTATAFSAGTFATSIDNANKVDVLRVAKNQIALADQEAPNAILMNPSDVTSLMFEKVTATDKRYIEALQVIGSTMLLDGVPIIASTLVTVDEYLIGNFDLATVYQMGAPTISIGLDGNDFTLNLVTILVEWRGCTVVKNNDRTAFVDGDFSTDQTALETI